jgi:hypothetical protein
LVAAGMRFWPGAAAPSDKISFWLQILAHNPSAAIPHLSCEQPLKDKCLGVFDPERTCCGDCAAASSA